MTKLWPTGAGDCWEWQPVDCICWDDQSRKTTGETSIFRERQYVCVLCDYTIL